MYSTSELDELFQILNSVKGFKLNNHIGATQQDVYTSREQVSCTFFVCGGIDSTYKVQTYTSGVTCGTILKSLYVFRYMCMNVNIVLVLLK